MDFSVVDEWATEEGVAEIGDSIFRSYDLKVKLSLEMVTANSFLLAGLLEAEGLIGTDLVKAYQRAASSLMLQVEGREDCLILLGSIELVRTWMEKAKDLGFLLSDPQSMMRRNLQQEQDSIVVTLEMWVAKNYVSMLLSFPSRLRPYADCDYETAQSPVRQESPSSQGRAC
ncbi:hypothetical protein HII31_00512 [Pseudocercospora fuligena]|uniref:Uncharacterized protein n=1 Tax=Pseudocercospora fuligena TaxID=685502 RepID=A0A8H6RXT3_9PEZI|nr:hypothetical protein HII31_00512 [Pseudocercospora fuligena]